MPIDPVKIPQNVYIEDRIVGPLTLRQIIIMAIGGGFSYMLYSSYQRAVGSVDIVMTVILWTPAAIAAAFALININDLSLTRLLMLLLERMSKPGLRTWAARTGISITIRTSAMAKEEPKKIVETVQAPGDQINTLSAVVDRNFVPTSDAAAGIATAAVAQPEPEPGPARLPVNPDRVQVDGKQISDLSVFRDVLPPTMPWH